MHYGAISDKIGEACACWLARWGTDLLAYELLENEKEESSAPTPVASRKRAKTIPSDFAPGNVSYAGTSKEQSSVPLIWSRGGLNAKWVAAIISADTFFIRGERERYTFARSVVELRRRDGIVEAEEQEWDKLFEHGIFYANMVCLKSIPGMGILDINTTAHGRDNKYFTRYLSDHEPAVCTYINITCSPLGSIRSPEPHNRWTIIWESFGPSINPLNSFTPG